MALLLPAALVTPMSALAQMGLPADAGRGRELARQLCSSCHLVDPEQNGPVPDAVPSFMAIAARPGTSEGDVIEALIGPSHPIMPQPPLDQQQTRDVAAYILSLR
jgi:mono/diheme cytochrome c family protein